MLQIGLSKNFKKKSHDTIRVIRVVAIGVGGGANGKAKETKINET